MPAPDLDSVRYVRLTTFRRTGTAVHTPVWFAPVPGGWGVITETGAGKVKRIRAGSRVVIAPCDARGRVADGAPEWTASARLVTGDEAVAVRRAVRRRYRVGYAAFSLVWIAQSAVERLRRTHDALPETAIVFAIAP
jgi:PPOX class probable F420-dependent enzyme